MNVDHQPGIEWPTAWGPSSGSFASTTLAWEATHRCTQAYRRRIAQDVEYAWTGQPPNGQPAVTLCEFDLEVSTTTWPDDGTAWMASMPRARRHAGAPVLPHGTALESYGWAGDQTEGLEVLVWRPVDGPVAGRGFVHTPDGGRYGSECGLVSALIVGPDQPIAHDPVRIDALLRDLARLAPEMIAAAAPLLPARVLARLDEARHLNPKRLLALAQMPSDHWSDVELRTLEERADSIVNDGPLGLLRILQTAVSSALDEGVGKPGRTYPGVPMNFLAWQALWRAALGDLADGLTDVERERLAAGWERVKDRARRPFFLSRLP